MAITTPAPVMPAPQPLDPETQAALDLLARRRAEQALDRPERRPALAVDVVGLYMPSPPAPAKPARPLTWGQPGPDEIKVWPLLVLAAVNNNRGGGARLWFMARKADCTGRGWIYRGDLRKITHKNGVSNRKFYRWLSEAESLGLVLPEVKRGGGKVYRVAGLVAGAQALGVDRIGRPAVVPLKAFTARGWRAHVWAAYLVTTGARPISQKTKEKLTGVKPCTQRNYQAARPVDVRKNYARTNRGPGHLTGLIEVCQKAAFVGDDRRVYYRLPDGITVPDHLAKQTRRGRSHKAQKRLNMSFYAERQKINAVRLFSDTAQGAKNAKTKAENWPGENPPREVFYLRFAGLRSNIWQPVAVTGGF